MTKKLFYQLTEVLTTPLDVMWLILAISFSYYYYGKFDWRYTPVAFVLVFVFHLIVNMQNNYMDYKNSNSENYQKNISTIGKSGIPLKTVRNWLWGMGIPALIIGLILAYKTGWPTLIIGLLAIYLGLSYSGGPRPFNSTPLAEFSVATPIGFFIPLTYVYLGTFTFSDFTWRTVGEVILVTSVNWLLMYATQLANNTCDLDEDVKNDRHTLVYFIGKKHAVTYFKFLVILAFIMIPIIVFLHLMPYLVLITLLMFSKTWKTLQPYFKNQIKQETYYPNVLKNLSQVMIVYIGSFVIGTILHALF